LIPDCSGSSSAILGDGICDNLDDWFNIPECGYDFGDCLEYNLKYSNCQVKNPIWLGYDICDSGNYSSPECNFDGGDCLSKTTFPTCIFTAPPLMSRGYCNVEFGHTTKCTYFADKYPYCNATDLSLIGDGVCDHSEYNIAECGYEDYDCVTVTRNCKVDYFVYIGDGTYHAVDMNTEECGWDGGDCLRYNSEWPRFKEKYPNCKVAYPAYLFDGICEIDFLEYYDDAWLNFFNSTQDRILPITLQSVDMITESASNNKTSLKKVNFQRYKQMNIFPH